MGGVFSLVKKRSDEHETRKRYFDLVIEDCTDKHRKRAAGWKQSLENVLGYWYRQVTV